MNMKKFFKALLKGIAYALLFLAAQVVVSFWMSMAYMVKAMLAGTFSFDTLVSDILDLTLTVSAVSGVLLAGVLLLIFMRRGIPRTFAFNPPPRLAVPVALIAGILLNIVVSWVLDRLPIPDSALSEYSFMAGLMNDPSPVVTFLALVIAAPVSEEMVFRGLVLPAFRKGMPAWLAVLLSALVFGSLHGLALWIAYAAFLGAVLGAVRVRTNSLWPCIALHMGFNFGNYPMEYILAGGGTLYTFAFIVACIGAAAGIIYLMTAPRREPRLALVLLAAGRGERFGGGKLTYEYGGQTLIGRALSAVPEGVFSKRVCVASDAAVAAAAAEAGFTVVTNKHPERGISSSIRLGIGRCSAEAYMFMVADQPRLTAGTVEALASFYRAAPEKLAAAGYDGRRGNPCVFPEKYVDELWRLPGDEGGSRVIAAHENELRLMQAADPAELWDVDTREDIPEAQNA